MSTKSTAGPLLPIGTIVATAINQDPAPAGWIICDGRVIPPQYQQLIAAIGPTTPNLSGLVLMGTGTNYPLRSSGGEYTHQLTVNEMPNHTHQLVLQFALNGGCPSGSGDTPCQQSGSIFMTTSAGGDHPHNNVQPYYAIIYIIYGGPY